MEKTELSEDKTHHNHTPCDEAEDEGCCGNECGCICCTSPVFYYPSLEIPTAENVFIFSLPISHSSTYFFERTQSVWHPPKMLISMHAYQIA